MISGNFFESRYNGQMNTLVCFLIQENMQLMGADDAAVQVARRRQRGRAARWPPSAIGGLEMSASRSLTDGNAFIPNLLVL